MPCQNASHEPPGHRARRLPARARRLRWCGTLDLDLADRRADPDHDCHARRHRIAHAAAQRDAHRRHGRHLSGHRGPGRRRARAAREGAPGAGRPVTGRGEGPRQGPVREGEPARRDRGGRGHAQGPRPPARRFLAGRSLCRPPRVAGRGLLRPRDARDGGRLQVGRHRGRREGDLRPRVHPRAPGPELRPGGDRCRRGRPGRPLAGPARAGRRRCHAPDEPLADRAPRPRGSAGAAEG